MNSIKRARPSPAILVAVLALVTALAGTAIASGPDASTGGLSKKKVKKLIKKEVAKQTAKATGPIGPPGPAGADGTDGTDGADGTARAYAAVNALLCTGSPGEQVCPFDHAKGVTNVTRVFTGTYCIAAPGIDPDTVPAAATVEFSDTPSSHEATATTHAEAGNCGEAFEVETLRDGDTDDLADNIEFTIVIP